MRPQRGIAIQSMMNHWLLFLLFNNTNPANSWFWKCFTALAVLSLPQQKKKAACATDSLTPGLFSHLTIVTISIKDSRCPHIIKYAIYSIKYTIYPIKLTQWIETTNATGTQLPAYLAHPLVHAERHPRLAANPSQPILQQTLKVSKFCFSMEREEASCRDSKPLYIMSCQLLLLMKVEGSGYAGIFKEKRRSGAIQDIPQISDKLEGQTDSIFRTLVLQ